MKKNRKIALSTLLALLMALSPLSMSACKQEGNGGENSESVLTSSLTLNASDISLNLGEEYTLTATKENIDGDVVWFSSNPKAVNVENGKIKAVGEGTATITATVGEYTAQCQATVVMPRLSVSKGAVNLYENGTNTISVAVVEKEETAVAGISYQWTIAGGSEYISIAPSPDTQSVEISARDFGVAELSVSASYKGIELKKEIVVSVVEDYYIGANQNSGLTHVKGGYKKDLSYEFDVEGFDKSFELNVFSVYYRDEVIQDAVLEWESSDENVMKVEGDTAIACGKGVAQLTGKYFDDGTGKTAQVNISVAVDTMFKEKIFNVTLGNNASVDGLVLTFRNKKDGTDEQTVTVQDGKARLALIGEVENREYEVTSEIYGAIVSFGSVTIGEETEYSLKTVDFANDTQAGNTGETFNAETMSVTFTGAGSKKRFFVQGQEITGEHWFGFKFDSEIQTGSLSSFYYLNDSGYGIYIYFVVTGSQLAIKLATTENNWTEYSGGGSYNFGYPGIDDPYVFIRRHNENGKLAYTVYQNDSPTLDGAWTYTFVTDIVYNDVNKITVFGINSETSNYQTGITFGNMYSAETKEKLLEKYKK